MGGGGGGAWLEGGLLGGGGGGNEPESLLLVGAAGKGRDVVSDGVVLLGSKGGPLPSLRLPKLGGRLIPPLVLGLEF